MNHQLNTPILRSRLKLKSLQSEAVLKTHHPRAVGLLASAGIRPGGLRAHAAKILTAGAAATSFIISSPQSSPVLAALPAPSASQPAAPQDAQAVLKSRLHDLLPGSVAPLSSPQEDQISRLVHDTFGLHASAQLEGNRLNHSYGIIGAEQHLPRYPGDTNEDHGSFLRSGQTPGRGAWGYFAQSKNQLTPDLIAKEKYYVAVQTLYLPDWSVRLAYLRDWYKYRKVVVVNPANGKTIIADIADAGPAYWTGKHFGGSPAVMAYLGLNVGRQAGPVVLFFVDDPADSVPLGPLDYNLEKPQLLVSI